MKKNVIIIAGPTACGKTKFSVEAAKKFGGEIISSDSMQIYKKMDIGTAKVTIDEMQGIRHHLLDIVCPDEDYSVANFQKDAKEAINDIISRGKIPVVVGGTGLYIHSLICDVDFTQTKGDNSFRDSLNEKSCEELYEMLLSLDKDAAERIHKNDKKRLIRRLEILNDPENSKDFDFRKPNDEYNFINICLDMPRDILYDRINKRVDLMLEEGLLAEVEDIVREYGKKGIAMQAIGYKEIIAYFDGECSLESAVDTIKQSSRRYAKRQLTWFRREQNFKWFDISEYDTYQEFLDDAIKYIEGRLQ